MAYEYQTTTLANHVLGGERGVQSPKPPDGDGWELFLVSATESTRFLEWRRPVPPKKGA